MVYSLYHYYNVGSFLHLSYLLTLIVYRSMRRSGRSVGTDYQLVTPSYRQYQLSPVVGRGIIDPHACCAQANTIPSTTMSPVIHPHIEPTRPITTPSFFTGGVR